MRVTRSARQWRAFLILAVALQGCAGAAVTTTSSRAPVSVRDTTLNYLNRPPGNDSLAVMKAVGEQVQKDYRNSTLLFSKQPVCGDVHPAPCQPPGGDAGASAPVVDVVMRAAGGTPACGPPPPTCPRPDQHAITIEVSYPRLAGDSARVTVSAYTRIGEGKDAFVAFERYIYGLTRMSPYVWRATVRYLESTGSYEYARPPASR